MKRRILEDTLDAFLLVGAVVFIFSQLRFHPTHYRASICGRVIADFDTTNPPVAVSYIEASIREIRRSLSNSMGYADSPYSRYDERRRVLGSVGYGHTGIVPLPLNIGKYENCETNQNGL